MNGPQVGQNVPLVDTKMALSKNIQAYLACAQAVLRTATFGLSLPIRAIYNSTVSTLYRDIPNLDSS
jgi:hypothetical protein